MVIRDTGEVVILLQDVKKEDAFAVKGRLEDALKAHTYKKKGLLEEIRINLGVATFPDEADDDEALINKARSTL